MSSLEQARTHSVQFFETDSFLCDTIGDFALAGLREGQPVVVIATSAHRDGLVSRLRASGFDPEQTLVDGVLVMLDADRTLRALMVDERPDPDRFHDVVGVVIEAASKRAGTGQARAYGEMVDLLWRDGKRLAALELEDLWNALATRHSFSLLCAYLMDSFYRERTVGEICARHTHVLDPESIARAERDAAAARRDLEEFLNSAVAPIHAVDRDGTVVWANQATLALLGYRADELVGQPVARIFADASVVEDLQRRSSLNETVRDYEARTCTKGGEIRYVLLSSRPPGRSDTPGTTRWFGVDITDRKLAELERERLIVELTRTVRVNEMFASVLGHDLRNPLNAIVMSGHLLVERNGDADTQRAVQRMLRSATRMERMIDQLLDLSHARKCGGIPLTPAVSDLGTIARDVVEELRVGHPDVAIDLDTEGDLAGLWDVNRLSQVFSNLVGNAIQHGRGESVTLSMRASQDRVVATLTNKGTIDRELLPILFSPSRGAFQRGPMSNGLGLGLFITDQIVRAHGGTVSVTSENEVTRFQVELPRRAPAAAAVASFDSKAATASEMPRSRDVSVVTDSMVRTVVTSIRDYAIFMLDPGGYITSWNTGAQLIKGYTTEEIIGQHFSVFYPSEDVSSGKCERGLEIAARDGVYEEEGWRLRKDGSPFWASVVITAVHNYKGDLLGYAKVTRDLTAQHLAKEAEQRAEERLRLLVDSVKCYAVFMLDREGYITTWSAGAERISGYQADEIIGHHFSVFCVHSDESSESADCALQIASREGRFEEEKWLVRKDGSRFWGSVAITALRDKTGTLVGFGEVTRDLTEHFECRALSSAS